MGFWLFAHLLAMAFFVGGQLMLVAVVLPVHRAAPDDERLRALARRFGDGSWVALGVLLISGVQMASHEDLWDSGTLHVKLGLVAATVLATVVHARRPGRHWLEGLVFLLSLAIVALGVSLAT